MFLLCYEYCSGIGVLYNLSVVILLQISFSLEHRFFIACERISVVMTLCHPPISREQIHLCANLCSKGPRQSKYVQKQKGDTTYLVFTL